MIEQFNYIEEPFWIWNFINIYSLNGLVFKISRFVYSTDKTVGKIGNYESCKNEKSCKINPLSLGFSINNLQSYGRGKY